MINIAITIIIIVLTYYFYDKYYKSIYYFVLNNILTPYFRFQARYYINNFEEIIKPYFKGNVTRYNNTININRNAKNEYTLIDKKHISNLIPKLKVTNTDEDTINKLLNVVSSYIHCDGEPVDVDDLMIVDVLNIPGNYFPFFHTDIEWNTFYKYNGFQIWILLEEDEKIKPRGNMFIMETDIVEPGRSMSIKENEIIIEKNGSGNFNPKIINTYESLNDINPTIKYLKCNIGDIFLMNPSVYHSSDPIVRNTTRRAINLRVIHNNKRGNIEICDINNSYSRLLRTKHYFKCSDNTCILMNSNNTNMKYKFK
jgi:hypothetical protein